jgi:hypothetical protein
VAAIGRLNLLVGLPIFAFVPGVLKKLKIAIVEKFKKIALKYF